MVEYACDEDGNYNACTRAYKNNPSMELYLKLRRDNPDNEIEISFLGGIEALYCLEPELRKFGFDPQLVATTMDADPDAISELSLQIMQKIISAKAVARSGKTHLIPRQLAVPNKLIDWLVACMLESLSWNDHLYIPRDLIVLIRDRIGASNSDFKRAVQTYEMRRKAIIIGGQLMARGVTPTFRLLGRILDVAPSTVKRWFPEGDFVREVRRVSLWFDKEGRLLDLNGGSRLKHRSNPFLTTGPGGEPLPPLPELPKNVPRRFHGSVTLDPTRVGRDAGRIADEVVSHLTGLMDSTVKITLEIDAEIPSGTPDQVVRTVTENCRTLKFTSQGFETE
jgi:hypothetical protein